jgi:hypothetical protein
MALMTFIACASLDCAAMPKGDGSTGGTMT